MFLDPVSIAGLRFTPKRAHAHPPLAVSSLHRKVDLGSGLMHERLMRGRRLREPLPVHRSDEVAGFELHAGRAQRTRFIRVPGIAVQETADAVAAGGVIPAQVRAQEPNRVARRLPVIAAHVVGVRRAKLALHLQNEVGKFRAAIDTSDERRITLKHALPIDLGHIGAPEMIALQPPRFMQHLLPFGFRLDQHFQSFEVDEAAIAGLAAFLFHPLARLQDADLPACE